MVLITRRREVSLQLDTFQLSIVILALIPIFLATIFQLIIIFTSTGRKRILAILGFLIALFVLLPLSISAYYFLILEFYLIWNAIYGPISWILYGFSQLFLVYYLIILAFPDLFRNKKWTIILPIIGFAAYEVVAILVPLSQLTLTVFLIYNVIYVLIIPLITTYFYLRLDRIRGTPRVKWILVITLGVVIWFISYALMYIPEYLYHPSFLPPGALLPLGVGGLGWWIILLGSFMDMRAGRQSTD